MTWQEFGDFIAMEAKFSFLKDLGEWWKQQDEWFEDIPMLELTNLPGNWMQKSRIMKLIDVYKSDEDKIFKQGGFKILDIAGLLLLHLIILMKGLWVLYF